MAPVRVSVIGAGMALQCLHWPSIVTQPDLFVLHSVLDRSGRGGVKEMCGQGVKVVSSLQEVVDDPEVELVVVASPNNTHLEYATAALKAGKHVLVEKPMCPTSGEAQTLVDLAQKKNLILSVYQNRRWDADFLTVKKLIREGRLGNINEFQSNYDRYRPLPPSSPSSAQPSSSSRPHLSVADGKPQPRPWKETPGEHNDVIFNLGSHIIDQAYVLFGMPERVGCRVWDQRGIGLDEAFVMDLYYPPQHPSHTPLIVTLRASILSAMPKQQRFLIKGSRGTYTKFGGDPQEKQLYEIGTKGWKGSWDGFGAEDEADWGEVALVKEERDGTEWDVRSYPSERGNGPYLYTNLHQAISSSDASKLEVKPEQAVNVLRLIELGLQSSREGRVMPVKP